MGVSNSSTSQKKSETLRQFHLGYCMLTASIRNCAFVNYTKILNATKAIEAIKAKLDYGSLRIVHGKDRCVNPPRSRLLEGQSLIVSDGDPGKGNACINKLRQISIWLENQIHVVKMLPVHGRRLMGWKISLRSSGHGSGATACCQNRVH